MVDIEPFRLNVRVLADSRELINVEEHTYLCIWADGSWIRGSYTRGSRQT